MLSFAFDTSQGETPQTLENKRAIAQALAMRGMSRTPKNAGEGLAAIGNALAYAMAMGNYSDAESKAQKDYATSLNTILGGAPTPAAAPAAPAAPQQPQIPAAAVSGGDLTNTPAPLSGGTMPQAGMPLTDAVAKLESGGSPINGPAGGYANYRFQQFPAFVKQYGSGENGVVNYAKKVLAANPNATFGDMYGGYVTGTGNPATAAMSSLKTTTQPGAQGAYGNLVRNSPIDPKTPLAQLVGTDLASLLGPASAYADTPKPGDTLLQQPAPMPAPMGTIPLAGDIPLPAARPDAAPASFDQRFASAQPPGANFAQRFGQMPPAAPIPSVPMPVQEGMPSVPPPLPTARPVVPGDQAAPLPAPVQVASLNPRQQVAQALTGGFTPGPLPNVTNVPTRPATLPVEGRAGVVQALANQPTQAPVGNIPPQVAEMIRKLSVNPLPQAQQMAAQLMQRYMQPPQYDLVQGADGTVTAINKLNPRDNYVAAHIAAKPIAVPLGGSLVAPGQPGATPSAQGAPGTAGGYQTVYQNANGMFDKKTLTSMADQYLAGDKSVLQNLGRTAIGGMNMTALRERIVSRAEERGISPTETAARIGQFDSYTAAQKATGTRGGNVTMAATEAANLGNLVNETSNAVPRSNYPIWNKVTNSYAENTGDPKIVQFTGALNSYINAYARAINPSGSTTVSDKEHAREILDTAMSNGQIEAGIAQLQKELEQAKRAPSSASQTIKSEFMNNSNPQNSIPLSQAREAIAKGAPRDAVIQRLQKLGIDPSGL